MSESYFFIVNSRIGHRKINAVRTAIGNYFSESIAQIHLTEYGGHARKLSEQAVSQNANVIVAIGGDGTVNEVIQEMAHTNCQLAIVPTGSGNGLARHLGLSLHIETAIKDIKQAELKTIDLGKINDVYFISNAGIGFDAMICNAIKQSKFRGLKMYILEVMKHYFSFKPSEYEINVDGKKMKQEAFFFNIANGSEFGYGFRIAPSANLNDGMLDIVIIKNINVWNGFGIVRDGFKGRLEKNKHCIHLKGKQISITSTLIPHFQTDGDAHNNTNNTCLIEVQPNAINILVPKNNFK
jgi:diacylglycerol kinase (ATP)